MSASNEVVLTSVSPLVLYEKVSLTISEGGKKKHIEVDFKNLETLMNESTNDVVKQTLSGYLDRLCDKNITPSTVEGYLRNANRMDKWGDVVVYMPNRVSKEDSRLEDSVFFVGETPEGTLTVVPMSKSDDGTMLMIPVEFHCPRVDPGAILQDGFYQYGPNEDDFFEWDNLLFPVRPSLFTIKMKGLAMNSSTGKTETVIMVVYGDVSYLILLGEGEEGFHTFMNRVADDTIFYMMYEDGMLRMVY